MFFLCCMMMCLCMAMAMCMHYCAQKGHTFSVA